MKWVFCDLCVLVRKLVCPFGHPTQAFTQVQLSTTCITCESVWPGQFQGHSNGQEKPQAANWPI